MFDEKKITLAKEILSVEDKHFTPIFNLFESEINELISYGLKYSTIFKLIKKEIGEESEKIKYKTFYAWVKKNLGKKKKVEKKTEIDLEDARKKIENLW